ncbi:Eyes absent homolog [Klebsormidium nitens]|uniref:protein-tyrosine-phosphatase n=1 Tax=Klebsormidium nitens TaxID=105231 RepID=A0A1Y1IND4_KLENI|nr:Eyes absent homolog [Klebsormidium nitens]|eukprot:GAQ90681.1 Eyes absent homolog [Klebsormidium nitens]
MKQEEATDPGIVFVWDLDETLIIFQSLLTGKYADLEGLDEKRRAEALKLGEQWEKLILDISDTAMLFEQVEEFDQPSIGHVAENDDGASLDDFDFGELNLKKPLTDAGKQKLAYLYRHIQALYAKGATHLLTGDKRGEWQGLYAATDRFTKGWLFAGRRLLAECATARLNSSGQTDPNRTAGPGSDSAGEGGLPPLGKRTVVLVSSGQLIPTLTKCLLFRLDPWIDPANVYSSKVVGKLQCFKWIRERFGGGNAETRFCAVGDGVEEQAAARMMSWPFLRVASGLDPDMSLPKIRLEQLTDLLADVKSKT